MMYLRSLILLLLLPCAMAVRGATADEQKETRANQPVAASFLRHSLVEAPPQGMRHLEGFGPVYDEIDEIGDKKDEKKLKKKLKKVVKEYNKDPTSKKTDKAISKFLKKLKKMLKKGDISKDRFNKISTAFDNVFNPTTTTTTTTTTTPTTTTTTTTTTPTPFVFGDFYWLQPNQVQGTCLGQSGVFLSSYTGFNIIDAEACGKACHEIYGSNSNFLGMSFNVVRDVCVCHFSGPTLPTPKAPIDTAYEDAIQNYVGPISATNGYVETRCYPAKNGFHPTDPFAAP